MNDDTKFAKAHQAIGQYFSEFSELERELGEAVKVVLHLEGHDAADIVVAALRYPSAKASLVRAAANVATKKKDGTEISTKWKARADKTLGKILNHNEACRDHLAHSRLEPQKDGSVKVTRHGRRNTSKVWNLKNKIDEVRRLTKRLRGIRDELSKVDVPIRNINMYEALFRDDPRRYLQPWHDQTQGPLQPLSAGVPTKIPTPIGAK